VIVADQLDLFSDPSPPAIPEPSPEPDAGAWLDVELVSWQFFDNPQRGGCAHRGIVAIRWPAGDLDGARRFVLRSYVQPNARLMLRWRLRSYVGADHRRVSLREPWTIVHDTPPLPGEIEARQLARRAATLAEMAREYGPARFALRDRAA